MQTIRPQALMLPDTEIKISLTETESGRGYVHVRASLGLSRWCGVLPIGYIIEREQNEAD